MRFTHLATRVFGSHTLSPSKHWTTLGLVLLLAFLSNGTASAQQVTSGGVEVFPTTRRGKPAFSKNSGLQLTIDSTWLGDRGYRPVRVTIRSQKATKSEKLVTVVLHNGWGADADHASMVVKKEFPLLQGATQATVTLLMPQYDYWYTLRPKVWIDGKLDDELSENKWNGGGNFNQPNSNDNPFLIVADKKAGKAVQSILQSASSSDPTYSMTVDSKELPKSWLGYTQLGAVASTSVELKKWAQQNPASFEAMLRWVRSGGNLWVMDGGTQWERLPEIEETLALRSAQQMKQATLQQPDMLSRGWQVDRLGSRSDLRQRMLSRLHGPLFDSEANTPEVLRSSRKLKPEKALGSLSWFVTRPYDLGTITAFRHDFQAGWYNKNSSMDVVERSELNWRLNWEYCHGNSPDQGNSDFYKLLIPGVGQAPVIEFQLLISLFVLAIGPLNYWVLKRRRRLPMLLVTVPTAAAATTLLLFSYGLIVDGFETRVRARSLTLIDQRAGEAVCWARLSYFAGLAPKDGLRMPTDTAIYPIFPSWSDGYNNRHQRQRREMQWDGAQKLKRGWLFARTPTQYQTITARPTKHKLLLREAAGKVLHVTNQLGVEVLFLAVQDHDGNVYLCDALPADASARLSPSTPAAAKTRLRTLVMDNEPELPVDFSLGRNYYNNVGLEDNLMNSYISALVMPKMQNLGNGTYIAITAQGVELSMGVDEAREEASFHVLRGTW